MPDVANDAFAVLVERTVIVFLVIHVQGATIVLCHDPYLQPKVVTAACGCQGKSRFSAINNHANIALRVPNRQHFDLSVNKA